MLTIAYAQFNRNTSNFVTGLGSALIDNVPLTAALLKAEPYSAPQNG